MESRRCPKPGVWIQSLDPDPLKYKAGQGASFWCGAFSDGPPISPRIDLRSYALLDASFKARGFGQESAGANSAPQLATAALVPASSSSELQTVQTMGNMMLQGMQQMASQQSRMMEYIMSGSATPGLRQLLDSASPRVTRPPPSAGRSPLPIENLVIC